MWKNGLRDGEGKYILKNGEIKYGFWVKDKRVRWIREGEENRND
jgi:hypothetical protein